MANSNDGKTKKNRPQGWDETYEGQALKSIELEIQSAKEKGDFTQKEQVQINDLTKLVKDHGGLGNMQKEDVKALIDIIKTLGSKGDKTTMEKDEISDLVSNIKKGKQL